MDSPRKWTEENFSPNNRMHNRTEQLKKEVNKFEESFPEGTRILNKPNIQMSPTNHLKADD
jgi:hypothetical protein